ncbi:MAG: hypothetical protein MUQ56_07510 [Thermoleophilia bacterium]|nr:hypothetical protein [Thermoleophilia bacterium]
MALTFYLDDTQPYDRPIDTFRTFLDFCQAEGVRGEATALLGVNAAEHGLLSRPTTAEQEAFVEQLLRSYECGLGTHMELMTHDGLFDFDSLSIPKGAPFEGHWLQDHSVSLESCRDYFSNIIAEGDRIGLRFTGVTWPGCACQECEARSAGLLGDRAYPVNPHVWTVLLELAKQGKFRGRTVPCFMESNSKAVRLMAGDGPHAVYDFFPTAKDYFGSYDNNPARASADYYLTADGESGRIVELLHAGAPYCLFYAHWQGINPHDGVGWEVFREVVHRVNTHLRDRVVWMRPSDYTDRYHETQRERGGSS